MLDIRYCLFGFIIHVYSVPLRIKVFHILHIISVSYVRCYILFICPYNTRVRCASSKKVCYILHITYYILYMIYDILPIWFYNTRVCSMIHMYSMPPRKRSIRY